MLRGLFSIRSHISFSFDGTSCWAQKQNPGYGISAVVGSSGVWFHVHALSRRIVFFSSVALDYTSLMCPRIWSSRLVVSSHVPFGLKVISVVLWTATSLIHSLRYSVYPPWSHH